MVQGITTVGVFRSAISAWWKCSLLHWWDYPSSVMCILDGSLEPVFPAQSLVCLGNYLFCPPVVTHLDRGIYAQVCSEESQAIRIGDAEKIHIYLHEVL